MILIKYWRRHGWCYRLTWEQLRDEAPLPCLVHWNQRHFVLVYRIRKRRAWGRAYWEEAKERGSEEAKERIICFNVLLIAKDCFASLCAFGKPMAHKMFGSQWPEVPGEFVLKDQGFKKENCHWESRETGRSNLWRFERRCKRWMASDVRRTNDNFFGLPCPTDCVSGQAGVFWLRSLFNFSPSIIQKRTSCPILSNFVRFCPILSNFFLLRYQSDYRNLYWII